MRALRVPALLVVVALLVSACAVGPVTRAGLGEVLIEIGTQFIQTAARYDTMAIAGLLTREEYENWLQFTTSFQIGYAQAYAAWQAGGSSDELKAFVLKLKDELLIWYVRAHRERTT